MNLFGGLVVYIDCPSKFGFQPDSPVEQAIADLRYGSIGVNTWTAAVYGIRGLTWGAYPGESLDNVASGQGFVRNAYMLKGIEKSVLRSPFKAKSQLVIGPNGRPAVIPSQVRAVRQMVPKPESVPLWASSRNGQETVSHSEERH